MEMEELQLTMMKEVKTKEGIIKQLQENIEDFHADLSN